MDIPSWISWNKLVLEDDFDLKKIPNQHGRESSVYSVTIWKQYNWIIFKFNLFNLFSMLNNIFFLLPYSNTTGHISG